MTTNATLSRPHPTSRAAGALLTIAFVLIVACMAFHPRVHFHGKDDFVGAFAEIAMVNSIVHGALVVLFAVVFYGYSIFADRLDSSRPWARLGSISFVFGTIAIVAAAITSGFVVPEYVARYAGKSAADLEVMQHIVRLAFTIVGVGTRVGIVGLSLATVFWAIAVFGSQRTMGTVGLLAGGIPVVALAAGHLPMDVHGMMTFVLAQATWGLLVGVAMIRGRI